MKTMDIRRLAGKNSKAIDAIDECEGEYSVWLKTGFTQRGYGNTIIVVSEDDNEETVRYQLSLIESAA